VLLGRYTRTIHSDHSGHCLFDTMVAYLTIVMAGSRYQGVLFELTKRAFGQGLTFASF
jgi:hypothetical protein